MKKILLGIVALLVITLSAGYAYLLPTLKVATGYTAKAVCSYHFLTGQDVDSIISELPGNPLIPYLRPRIDEAKGEATVTLWGWAAKQKAILRPGLGCTLLAGDGPFETSAATMPPPAPVDPNQPWPLGEAVTAAKQPALEAMLDKWFQDPDPQNPRRTRAIIVVRDGQIIAERYGEGFSQDTRFQSWSMAKSVTSALLGILVQQGKLDIHDPAPIPAWQSPDDPRHAITVDQLIRMSSGLEFSEDYADLGSDVVQMLYNSSDMAAYSASKPLAADPDTVWNYASGTANILMGIIRDTIGGEITDYWAFPQEALFQPIGMNSAIVEPDASGTLVGSSYMYATARDWARFGLLFAQDGVWNGERMLPEGWVAYSYTPTPASSGQYGGTWWLNAGVPGQPDTKEWPDMPDDIYYASGHDGQSVLVFPSQNMVVVRLSVSRNGAWDMAEFLADVMAAVKEME
ncbi:MAG: serine hydrolase [Anaerolineales bacterium]|nr:serine hydrolase [Anaerolineales bacterium]